MRYIVLFFAWALLVLMLGTACKSPKATASRKHSTGKESEYSPPSEAEIKRIALIQKYALLLETGHEHISNYALYEFIDEWYGTPYKYGGKSKDGVDCSGFLSILMAEVYNTQVQGPSYSIYSLCKPLQKDELREGDFVFFKIEKEKISHVGVYLTNNKFIHATTKRGVMIDDLNNPYYKKYYYAAGRLPHNNETGSK